MLGDSWPKTERARHGLAQAIGDDEVDTQALFDLLADDRPAADDALPDTGVGARMERLLSPIFVRSPHYGTRASSAVILDRSNGPAMLEQGWQPDGQTAGPIVASGSR